MPCRRQAREGNQTQKGAIAALERHHLPNCKQAFLLTKTSWDFGRLHRRTHPPGGSQPEISSPEETHGTSEKALWLYTQKTEQVGRGRR